MLNNNPSLEIFNQSCHQYKGIVISSKLLQSSLMSKFGITPAEFLRPFLPRRVLKLKLGLKEREKEFNIKLLDMLEYNQLEKDVLDKFSRKLLGDSMGEVHQIQTVTKQSTKQQLDVIFEQNKMVSSQALQQIVGDCVGYNYHLNFLDQPVMIVYAVSGQEQNVVKELQAIKAQSDKLIRSMFQNNLSDLDQVKKTILILNDQQEVVQFESLDQINKEFPNYQRYIQKYNNPQAIETTNWHRFSFQRYFYDKEVPRQPLAILDENQTKIYRQMFEEIIMNLVIPYLERFINILTQQYLENKQRSLDNFFNFLKRTDNQKYENDYSMSQREYILRYLGDHHFLMNDYESAAQYYKALISELKNNKTNITVAQLCAQEYYLYSRLLASQKIENIWNIYDEIQNGYSKISFPYMLRVLFFYVNTINTYQRFTKDQIIFLQRCHRYFKDQGNLHKPDCYVVYQILVYEQISFIYLKLDPPQLRRFAHNLTLVANKYDSEHFKKHALRCFKTVEQLYQNSKWSPILFWLQGHIGANYLENRKVPEALDAFKAAFNLLNERQPIDLHNQLVIDWKKAISSIESVNDYRKKFFSQSTIRLKMPIIKGAIDILTQGITHLPSIYTSSGRQRNKTLWNTLLSKDPLSFYEEAMIKGYDAVYLEERIACFNKYPCIIDFKKLNFADKFDKFARQIFIDDPVVLKIFIQLPLKVASNITELQVLYEFYVEETQVVQDLLDLDESDSNNNKQMKLIQKQLPEQCIQVVNLSFQRGVQEYIEVSITPSMQGYLVIKGVSWCYLGIPTQIDINYDATDQSKRKSVNFYNKFKVFPKFQPIQIEFNTKPTIVYGEVRPIIFKFTNPNPIDVQLFIQPITAYHFGFTDKQLIVQANSILEHTFYLRCTFQDDFVGQLLIKYQQPIGGTRVHKIEIPMKAEPSFKISLQTDVTHDYWKFTLLVQDYFGGRGDLKFDRILCLNQNWELDGECYQSIGQSFIIATFRIKKLKSQQPFDAEDYNKRLKEQFYLEGDKFNEISLTEENTITHDTAIDFINLDIRHYFNIFYQKTQHQETEEFPLFIIARWSHAQNEETIYGLHELPVIPPSYFHKTQNELPLIIKYESPQVIYHDFTLEPLCCTSVKITFKNVKFVEPIKISVQMFNGDEPVKNISDIQQPGYLWEGQMFHEFSINPQESYQMNMNVIFTEKGVYDLSRFRIIMLKTQREYYSMDYDQIIIKIL